MKRKISFILPIIILAVYTYSCRSVGLANLEYMIHNKTKHDVIVLWETASGVFDSSEVKQDTVRAYQSKILSYLPGTISKGIGCDRNKSSTDTTGVISEISIFQIHYVLDQTTSKFYKFDPMDCDQWKQSRLNKYKTFILPINESDFE